MQTSLIIGTFSKNSNTPLGKPKCYQPATTQQVLTPGLQVPTPGLQTWTHNTVHHVLDLTNCWSSDHDEYVFSFSVHMKEKNSPCYNTKEVAC